MVPWQETYCDCPSLMIGNKRVPAGGVSACPVAVEAEDRGCGVQPNQALHNRGCSRGLNPPASSRHLAM